MIKRIEDLIIFLFWKGIYRPAVLHRKTERVQAGKKLGNFSRELRDWFALARIIAASASRDVDANYREMLGKYHNE